MSDPNMSSETKICPFCGEEVLVVAKKCRFCREFFDPKDRTQQPGDAVERMLLPVGRPGSAIAAGYLGLFFLFPFVGIFAILFGVIALKTIRRDPSLSGRGRAWFGIIAGILGVLLWGAFLVGLIYELLTKNRPHYG